MTAIIPPDHEPPIESWTDPVCGAVMTKDQVKQWLTYRGAEYAFDRPECLKKFMADPDKYASTQDSVVNE